MTTITVRYTDVTEGWHDVEGVDVEATNEAWGRLVEAALRERFPTAEIEVSCLLDRHGNIELGAADLDSIDAEDYDEDQEFRLALAEIYDTVNRDSDKWTVRSWTSTEAAEKLGVSVATTRRAASAGNVSGAHQEARPGSINPPWVASEIAWREWYTERRPAGRPVEQGARWAAVLTNDFHDTSARVLVPADGILSVAQVKRVRQALCGISDCRCCGNLKERGLQTVEIDPLGDGRVKVTPKES